MRKPTQLPDRGSARRSSQSVWKWAVGLWAARAPCRRSQEKSRAVLNCQRLPEPWVSRMVASSQDGGIQCGASAVAQRLGAVKEALHLRVADPYLTAPSAESCRGGGR